MLPFLFALFASVRAGDATDVAWELPDLFEFLLCSAMPRFRLVIFELFIYFSLLTFSRISPIFSHCLSTSPRMLCNNSSKSLSARRLRRDGIWIRQLCRCYRFQYIPKTQRRNYYKINYIYILTSDIPSFPCVGISQYRPHRTCEGIPLQSKSSSYTRDIWDTETLHSFFSKANLFPDSAEGRALAFDGCRIESNR